MIFSIAQTTGWTIEYIVWNLSVQQIILLSKASEELYGNKKDVKRLEDSDDPEGLFKQIFGPDVFEGR
jgi:hypothetical protein